MFEFVKTDCDKCHTTRWSSSTHFFMYLTTKSSLCDLGLENHKWDCENNKIDVTCERETSPRTTHTLYSTTTTLPRHPRRPISVLIFVIKPWLIIAGSNLERSRETHRFRTRKRRDSLQNPSPENHSSLRIKTHPARSQHNYCWSWHSQENRIKLHRKMLRRFC